MAARDVPAKPWRPSTYMSVFLPDRLVDELDDALQRTVRRRRARLAHDEALPFAGEELEIEHAAGLAICGHEAVEVRSRMRDVVRALQIQHGRHLDLLALLERGSRGTFVHRHLGLPVHVVGGEDLIELRLAFGLEVLGVAITAERID